MIKKKTFIKNLLYAFSAQAISLLLSIIMSMFVPKMLGKVEFGYWQLFLFYTSYSGFLAFGLNDGLYLKYGGKDYDDLNHGLIGSQIKVNILMQCLLGLIIVGVIIKILGDTERRFVWCATIVFSVVSNLNAYIGYVFQAVNQTKKFSISTIIEKIVFLFIVILLMLFECEKFIPFVVLYIFAKLLSLSYSAYQGRKMLSSSFSPLFQTLKEMVANMKVGLFLMFANIASMLVLGIGRTIIDTVWGIKAFGEFSLSLSLCNFALTFITQVSMVLFPVLRSINDEEVKNFYVICRKAISLLLPIVFIAYIPVQMLLSWWLPEYKDSLYILGMLLPLCTYDGKMNLLCSTYFKVFHREKKLLSVNIIATCISFVLAVVGGFGIRNINFVVFGMVFAIAIRSILSEIILANMMNTNIKKELILETGLVLGYICVISRVNEIEAFVILCLLYVMFLLLRTNDLKMLVSLTRRNRA